MALRNKAATPLLGGSAPHLRSTGMFPPVGGTPAQLGTCQPTGSLRPPFPPTDAVGVGIRGTEGSSTYDAHVVILLVLLLMISILPDPHSTLSISLLPTTEKMTAQHTVTTPEKNKH